MNKKVQEIAIPKFGKFVVRKKARSNRVVGPTSNGGYILPTYYEIGLDGVKSRFIRNVKNRVDGNGEKPKETLSESIGKIIDIGLTYYSKGLCDSEFEGLILAAFSWDETPEGFYFWKEVSKRRVD